MKKEKEKKDARRTKRLSRSWYGDTMIFLLLALMGAFMLLPLVYMVAQSLKPLEEIFIFPPRFFVTNPTWNNYGQLSQLINSLWVPFSRYVFNSIFVSILVTFFNVVFSSMAAYPLAKHKFPGKEGIFQIITIALVFSGGALSLPQYIIMAKAGMIDTYWALVLPQIASSMGLFLMRQFMLQIPDAILESARIDGASEFRIFWQFVMPSVKPAYMTLALFAFQAIWNATGNNVIYSEQLKLLPTAMSQIATGGMARAGAGAASSIIMLIPPVLIFVITQSNVIETMAHSGMKD